jgi:NAD-dependent dihydropyrimidine dehydrogenase PreA subunit
MKLYRKIIEINEELCNGCGQCVPSCAEGALKVVDGKARLVKEIYCDGLGACLGECPTGALKMSEREAEDFDEKAVEDHLFTMTKEKPAQELKMASGCPSSLVQSFEVSNGGGRAATTASELSHWPVQIRLIPPNATFLRGADLLIASDCTAVAYPNFHRDFIKGRAVMIGCPKFDDTYEYVRRFADIFKTSNVKSLSVLVMEVPCCQTLPGIVQQGMERAGKNIPTEIITINAKGDIISREKSGPEFTTA